MRCLLILFFCGLTVSVQANEGLYKACLNIAKHQDNQEVDLQINCLILLNLLQKQGLMRATEPQLTIKASVKQLEFLSKSSVSTERSVHLNKNGLDQLIAGILIEDKADSKTEWWQAFLTWLESLKTGDYEPEYQWLVRFLDKLVPSEQMIRYFFFTSIGLLVLLSGWMLFSECHRAGLVDKIFRKRNSSKASKLNKSFTLNSIPVALPSRGSPAGQQIAALLEQVIFRLEQKKIIPSSASLTIRQIVTFLNDESGELTETFVRLIDQAEPVLYGNRSIDRLSLDKFWEDSQSILGDAIV